MKITNPAFDYDRLGQQYSGHRQTDSRIAEYVYNQLTGAKTVLNVGAGAGSYEPTDKYVVAVEPSVGKALMEYCLQVAKSKDIKKLILFSNTKLEAAIAMYYKYGFKEVAIDTSHYKRADIKMELIL